MRLGVTQQEDPIPFLVDQAQVLRQSHRLEIGPVKYVTNHMEFGLVVSLN